MGRVESDKHYWKDVLAGAAIGSFAGWIFTDPFDENVQVVPWTDKYDAGLTVSINW